MLRCNSPTFLRCNKRQKACQLTRCSCLRPCVFSALFAKVWSTFSYSTSNADLYSALWMSTKCLIFSLPFSQLAQPMSGLGKLPTWGLLVDKNCSQVQVDEKVGVRMGNINISMQSIHQINDFEHIQLSYLIKNKRLCRYLMAQQPTGRPSMFKQCLVLLSRKGQSTRH